MPALLDVRAAVVDIRTDTPKSADTVLIDTNVWFWLAYTKASINPPKYNQITTYPRYVQHALRAKVKLLRSGFSFAELAHIIERAEYDQFSIGSKHKISKKEFRHNHPSLRASVANEIEAAWRQVTAMTSSADVQFDDQFVTMSLGWLKQSEIDGYDSCIATCATNAGVTGVLTDDSDFATIHGLTVFTANNVAIQAAAVKGLLVTR